MSNADTVDVVAFTNVIHTRTENEDINEISENLHTYNTSSSTTDLHNNNINTREEENIPIVDNNNRTTITWNNMFDTELLPEIDLPEDKISKKQISIKNFDRFELETPSEDTNKKINSITNGVNKKNKKRKIQTNTSTAQTKVKKMIEKPVKKQKYTKTVKNWLNEIDPNNPVEGGNDLADTRISETEMLQSGQVFTDIAKAGMNKKMVQAQLTNKGGVMKFKKPIESDNNSHNPGVGVITSEKIEIIREQKSKAKFVAPIKEVKDITYDIIVIDSTYEEYMCNSGDVPDEVFLVLMYSEILTNILENKTVNCYDGKQLLIFFKAQYNLQANFKLIDAKIGGCLLDADNTPETFSELQKQLDISVDYTIATECASQKTAWCVAMLKECVMKLRSALTEESLWKVFIDIEMRLLPVIADMEQRGIMVDLDKLKSMENTLLTKIKAVEQECYVAVGRSFQINSHAQVRAILYDELQLDNKCNVKIRETICKGAKSTSETMLRGLMSVHPLPKLILTYRHLHKAHATFVVGIAQHVVDGVLRPMWEQTAAATGRIASSNPNVQAIPKAPFSLSFPEGNDGDQLLNFRSVYVAREGYTLLAADFKHVECRVFAYTAADTVLLDALKSGDDLFRVLAAKWLNKPEAQVSSEDRERTKRIVYASLYGAGARKLMDILDVSYDQALTISTSFNLRFPSLKSFGASVVAACEHGGGSVAAASGRRRWLRGLMEPSLRSHACRQAVNFVLQGSAADICKTAMIVTDQRLRSCEPPVEARLLLQIHDELVWEVAHAQLHIAAGIIKDAMENCGFECGLPARLPVAMSVGRNWGDMEHLDFTKKNNYTL
ncbi:DNA polymerase nu [Aphomia sociella]